MATTLSPQDQLRQTEQLFSQGVAGATGLDPRVVYAQVQAEGAYAPGGTGGLNFLNLKSATVQSLGLPYASSTSAGFAQFANLAQAETASAAEYRSPNIGLTTPSPTPIGQIEQIAGSNWDQSHYGGGQNLISDFTSLYGAGALSAPAEKTNIPITGGGSGGLYSLSGAPANPIGVGGISTATPGVGPVVSAAQSVAGGATGFFDWITNTNNLIRVGEIIGGSVLMLVGVIILARGATKQGPVKETAQATKVVTRTVTRRAPARRAPAPRQLARPGPPPRRPPRTSRRVTNARYDTGSRPGDRLNEEIPF